MIKIQYFRDLIRIHASAVKGDDYYMAVSTFEWFPGIPIYHSRDLKKAGSYIHMC